MHRGWQHPETTPGRHGKKLTEALSWRLRYSETDRAYLARKGAPEIAGWVDPESLFLWQAYHHLRGSRSIGFGVSPIPFSEMAAYCDWAGLTCPIERAFLVRAMTELDNAERAHHGRTAATA